MATHCIGCGAPTVIIQSIFKCSECDEEIDKNLNDCFNCGAPISLMSNDELSISSFKNTVTKNDPIVLKFNYLGYVLSVIFVFIAFYIMPGDPLFSIGGFAEFMATFGFIIGVGLVISTLISMFYENHFEKIFTIVSFILSILSVAEFLY